MRKRCCFPTVFLLLGTLGLTGCFRGPKTREAPGQNTYGDLVNLFQEWRELQKPQVAEGVPDYSRSAMENQWRDLRKLQSRLAAIDPSSWPVAQQIDYHVVRAEMNGLEFDHRVLRPWSRNPAFYTTVHDSGSDVPQREGPERYGTLELYKYNLPLAGGGLADFRTKLRAIPKLLEQAKENLTEDAKDLWFAGIWVKKAESAVLADLAQRLAEHHPDLVPDTERARKAVDDFRAWLEERHRTMTAPSGIGIAHYNWYMKNVHLIPYTWEEQLVILQRELDRAWAHLNLTEHRNRRLARLEPVATGEEYRRLFHRAVDDFMRFLVEQEILTVKDYMDGSLRAREGNGEFIPPDALRDFFTQIDYRDLLVMRCHGTHWFDLAAMEREPHSSLIRRVPLLYNIWDSRAEGLATGTEEMLMHAGLFDERPRTKELIYVLVANRAARAMGDLKMHSNELTLEEAVQYAVERTPHGWLSPQGNTVWFDEILYLQQPGYGTSYIVGKVLIEALLAERSRQLGDAFTLKRFMDELLASGMIPVSLTRWEMTGLKDEVERLFGPRR